VRKVFYVAGIVVLTPIGLVVGALTLWWFTTDNNASVNIWNRSGRTLHNLVIAVPGRSERFGDFGAAHSGGFAADPHLRYDVLVSFDTDGQHYELPARAYMLPFGDTLVSLSVDDQLRLFIGARPTFAYR
jgi:hypothetical protein